MSQVSAMSVLGTMYFLPVEAAGGPIERSDLRAPPSSPRIADERTLEIADARGDDGLGLETSGFALVHAPSGVEDFYDCDAVMARYYEECRTLAKDLTAAHTTFTFDHIIREPGRQLCGGGTSSGLAATGIEGGGGHIVSVHMDYTDNTTFDRYLELHGVAAPASERVIALNFWRCIDGADAQPLAVCDARTVSERDLRETVIYGYGAPSYSWYDIGIETFSVAASPDHDWYFYPSMTADEVLVIKSFDSHGVIGRACPHASFTYQPDSVPRRSIELRVLCFC